MIVFILIFALVAGPWYAAASAGVTTVDFLEAAGVDVNAAGPVLVRMDEGRNRLVVANTLTSSLSLIDCTTKSVKNIPLGGRAFQHLKAEAMTIDGRAGGVCLIGDGRIFVVDVEEGSALSISTDVQFESIAVDAGTGNIFAAGRESEALGFIEAGSKKIKKRKWLDTRENLINLNATPPPPIRKVVADERLGSIVAVDGMAPALYTFDAGNGKLSGERPLELEAGGRWHLAGYNEETHTLFVVIERDNRNVVQAARIDVTGTADVVVALPGYREGVAITYNPKRDEVYVGYDNQPSVHVVSFADGGALDEVAIPAFGNDAAAVDIANDVLYIGSWAHGEVDVIDLKERSLVRRITGLGIIPHMFTSAFNPNDGLLYFPKGASAVNGTFGAAVTALDPATGETSKVYNGWAPIDLVEMPSRGSFLVFNSEDQFAEVRPDGSYDLHRLPFDYPVQAIHNRDGDVYLSYGPHQSYWPTVYIWGAKNGVLTIDAEDLEFYDRRIPRQAHRMALDQNGVLYFTQNNWGKEEQFVGILPDPVRLYEANERLRLVDEVEREITQRILEYDPATNRLYLVRVGEQDDAPSVLQVIDPAEKEVVERIEVGMTASDLLFDNEAIYIANFDSKSVSIIDKEQFAVRDVETGEHPLRLCRAGGDVYVLNHSANSLQQLGGKGRTYKLPENSLPDNLFVWRDKAVITSHAPERLYIMQFDPESKKIEMLHRQDYPYGDTSHDTRNVSFYVRGQYGDVLFETTRAKTDADLRLWVTDFLSGKLFILN
jgi:DNA-binding beta-propeller fold protein YncE